MSMPISQTKGSNANVRITMDEHSRCPRWFVMRAYKCERMAEKLLSGESGLTYFIPKHYQVRTYHGKKQRELVPVIPSIVFIYACRAEIQEFRIRFGHLSLQYVMKNPRYSTDKSAYLTVPDKQMDDFIKVASQYESDITYYYPDEIALNKGRRVRVHGGQFDGVEGVLVKIKGKRSRRVVVMLDHIAAVAAAEIVPDLLEILPPASSDPGESDFRSSLARNAGNIRSRETVAVM